MIIVAGRIRVASGYCASQDQPSSTGPPARIEAGQMPCLPARECRLDFNACSIAQAHLGLPVEFFKQT